MRKNKMLPALLLAACLLLSACGNPPAVPTEPKVETLPPETAPPETQPPEPEVEPLSVLTGNHYRSEWSEDYITLGWVDWQSLTLSDTCAAAYPLLAQKLTQWNNDQRDYCEDMLEAMLPDAREAAAELGHDFGGYMETTALSIRRADSLILSVRCQYEGYTGMRPYYGSRCLNLDPATGEEVTIDRVITDMARLPQLLEDGLKAKYDDPMGQLEHVSEYLEGYSKEAYTWTLGYQGVTFYFGAAELETGEAGEMTVTLWFDEHPGLFAEAYTRAPENGYAVMLSQTDANEVDLTPGDGKRDALSVMILEESNRLYIGCNDTVVINEEHYGYYMDAYLVTPDGERFFLYVDSASDNDYRTMYIYDLTGGEPVFIAALSGDGFSGRWMEDGHGGSWYTDVFNDPAHFTLSARTNLLGTHTGTRRYHMDPATGIPQPETAYYILSGDIEPLVSKTDLEVLILPGQTTQTIPAGSRFRFLRTDNENYVDMLLDDGRECRILITWEEWRILVNGLPEEECFDGLMYAG